MPACGGCHGCYSGGPCTNWQPEPEIAEAARLRQEVARLEARVRELERAADPPPPLSFSQDEVGLRKQLRGINDLLEEEKKNHRECEERLANFLVELLDALQWQGGTLENIPEGIRILRRALALWHCQACRGRGSISHGSHSSKPPETCRECGGKGLNQIARDALRPRES